MKSRPAIMKAVAEAMEQRVLLTVTYASIQPSTSSPVAGTSLSFNLQANSDDSYIAGWSINFGDNSSPQVFYGNPSSVPYTYSQAGNYNAVATAFDGDSPSGPGGWPDGASYTTLTTVQVQPAQVYTPPTYYYDAQANSIAATAGAPWSAAVGGISDSNPNAQASDFSASLSVDNTNVPCTVAGSASGGFTISASATFSDVGTFFTQLNISDSAGDQPDPTNSAGNSSTAYITPALTLADAADSNLTVPANYPATQTVATIANYSGTLDNCSGTLFIDDNTYGVSFVSDPQNPAGALVKADIPALSYGSSYPATVNVTNAQNGLSASGSVSFTVTPIPLAEVDSSAAPATVGVPWSDAVARFTDHAYFSSSADFSADTTYPDFPSLRPNPQISADPNATPPANTLAWQVTDSQTFPVAGQTTIDTTITAPNGVLDNVATPLDVNFAPLSANGQDVSSTAWQSAGSVVVGTFHDSAGALSDPSMFSATYCVGGNDDLPATIVSLGNANYQIVATQLPGVPAGETDGSATLTESTNGFYSCSMTTGFSVFASEPPIGLTAQSGISAVADQSWSAVLAKFTAGNAPASNFSATVTYTDNSNPNATPSAWGASISADPNGGFDIGGGNTFGPYGGGFTVTLTDLGTTNQYSASGSVNVSLPPLPAPTGVTAVAAVGITPAEIDLSWTNPALPPGAQNPGYQILRSADGVNYSVISNNSLGNGASTYQDTSVAEGTHYWYEVIATNDYDADANFPQTSAASASADVWSAPAAPTSLTVTESDANQVILGWTNNSPNANTFYIERSDDGGSSFSVIDTIPPPPPRALTPTPTRASPIVPATNTSW